MLKVVWRQARVLGICLPLKLKCGELMRKMCNFINLFSLFCSCETRNTKIKTLDAGANVGAAIVMNCLPYIQSIREIDNGTSSLLCWILFDLQYCRVLNRLKPASQCQQPENSGSTRSMSSCLIESRWCLLLESLGHLACESWTCYKDVYI